MTLKKTKYTQELCISKIKITQFDYWFREIHYLSCVCVCVYLCVRACVHACAQSLSHVRLLQPHGL